MQIVEAFSGRVSRHRLGNELLLESFALEKRLDLLAGVGAHGERGLHHQPGILNHLVYRVSVQKTLCQIGGDGEPDAENENKDETELGNQLHKDPSDL